ncbi:TPA: hypothetical protein H1005_01295 [archaeon]|uniref:Nudix hydrolase domain-containing protein n=1 Tax=Candidatus Naiadarchaeum limnaeum TaxID=2756139 RepID=A0A832V3G7_9ARCH|nr:hypothetical protein [Candidatus Naiadarchaeales archaeon SRR2090153.bin1042]HIK00297.1 hypothetical protein [Candidatus Naiadarchaeum limnaeum]
MPRPSLEIFKGRWLDIRLKPHHKADFVLKTPTTIFDPFLERELTRYERRKLHNSKIVCAYDVKRRKNGIILVTTNIDFETIYRFIYSSEFPAHYESEYATHPASIYNRIPHVISVACFIEVAVRGVPKYLILVRRSKHVLGGKKKIHVIGGLFDAKDGSLQNAILGEIRDEVGIKSSELDFIGENFQVQKKSNNPKAFAFIASRALAQVSVIYIARTNLPIEVIKKRWKKAKDKEEADILIFAERKPEILRQFLSSASSPKLLELYVDSLARS